MTFIRTLGFSLCCVLLIGLIVISSFLENLSLYFILLALVGCALCVLFQHLDFEDRVDRLSILFIPSSVLTIILGYFTNFIKQALFVMQWRFEEIARTAGQNFFNLFAGYLGNFAQLLSSRMVFVELLILFIALFGPTYLYAYLTQKKAPQYKQLIWTAVCVAILAIIGWIIFEIIMSNMISSVMR